MAIETVRAFLKEQGLEGRIHEFDSSSATVALAAEALGTEPARIAKTLSFVNGDTCILIVAAGDAKIDNRKFKDFFGRKATMLAPDEVLRLTGTLWAAYAPLPCRKGRLRSIWISPFSGSTPYFPRRAAPTAQLSSLVMSWPHFPPANAGLMCARAGRKKKQHKRRW